ncbi:hypothetical protein WPS_11030 [Vulcanimicrobium alpinum]|uniref:Uncharacterized protein n=1 Tax=Vulcanimicrobium alpinum TaxID=3016050 RepID=A0AAN1XWZ8_UNVUL|nr:FAD-binding domain-containing protein [Vulcanimicrobium alpinum]BDE05827.1 hypothetical protein WPS_11030 [Vulcanimicrobium alpinum]
MKCCQRQSSNRSGGYPPAEFTSIIGTLPPWELGADFFLQHLLDGDQAANTLSWRWVAGLHTRGKTYLARRDNIRRYTEERLDPGVRLAASAPPLADDMIPAIPLALPPTRPAAGHRDLLLLHDDDLGIASFAPNGIAPAVACAFIAADARSPNGVAPPVRAFARALAADALAHAERDRSIPAGPVIDGGDAAGAAADLQRVAARFGTTRVVVTFAPVGPARDALDALRAQLARSGLEWSEVARDYDAVTWPFATRGFFGLRARIPAIVRELGLDGSD